ncbi:transposase, MuDR, MULE transposase domain protein [Tanacetum coccineum]
MPHSLFQAHLLAPASELGSDNSPSPSLLLSSSPSAPPPETNQLTPSSIARLIHEYFMTLLHHDAIDGDKRLLNLVKSCFYENVLDDLTVIMKDLSGAAMILANVSAFTPKLSKHYLNITKRNVVNVFRKDTVPGSVSG